MQTNSLGTNTTTKQVLVKVTHLSIFNKEDPLFLLMVLKVHNNNNTYESNLFYLI